MRILNKFFLLLIILIIASTSYSQNKASLQREYKKLKDEIKELQSQINQTNKERKLSLKEVRLINSKIKKRKALIDNMQVQMVNIDKEIVVKRKDVETMDSEIAQIKKEYANMVRWMSKNHSDVSKLAFVLESNSFRDAFNRLSYIRKYGDYRARQSSILRMQINRVMSKINALNEVKTTKQTLLVASKHEQNKLLSEKKERDNKVKKLGGEISKLKSQVKDKNAKAAKINSRIKKIIEEEIRKERERQLAKYKKKNNDPNATYGSIDLSETPEGKLSTSFSNSKGSLPWPVSNGEITSSFGKQPHPDDPSIYIQNNGVDIKTNTAQPVKSIYSGKVVRIFTMPSYNTCVMIKHGDYFSVYSYLASASVSEGQDISANQTIGISGFDADHGYSLVNLQIWHYQNKQNPVNWISRR